MSDISFQDFEQALRGWQANQVAYTRINKLLISRRWSVSGDIGRLLIQIDGTEYSAQDAYEMMRGDPGFSRDFYQGCMDVWR